MKICLSSADIVRAYKQVLVVWDSYEQVIVIWDRYDKVSGVWEKMYRLGVNRYGAGIR